MKLHKKIGSIVAVAALLGLNGLTLIAPVNASAASAVTEVPVNSSSSVQQSCDGYFQGNFNASVVSHQALSGKVTLVFPGENNLSSPATADIKGQISFHGNAGAGNVVGGYYVNDSNNTLVGGTHVVHILNNGVLVARGGITFSNSENCTTQYKIRPNTDLISVLVYSQNCTTGAIYGFGNLPTVATGSDVDIHIGLFGSASNLPVGSDAQYNPHRFEFKIASPTGKPQTGDHYYRFGVRNSATNALIGEGIFDGSPHTQGC